MSGKLAPGKDVQVYLDLSAPSFEPSRFYMGPVCTSR